MQISVGLIFCQAFLIFISSKHFESTAAVSIFVVNSYYGYMCVLFVPPHVLQHLMVNYLFTNDFVLLHCPTGMSVNLVQKPFSSKKH